MASIIKLFSLVIFIVVFFICVTNGDVFEPVWNNMLPCEDVCENSYMDHTYEKGLHKSYCKRGCRFYSILDFINSPCDVNVTKEGCISACTEAYAKTDEQQACNNGCLYQIPFATKRRKELLLTEASELIPMMYVQEMYIGMRDRVTRTITTSWSYFIQKDGGRVVVIQNQPRTFTEFMKPHDSNNGIMTSNYFETNLNGIDNSATPNLKNAQIRSSVSEVNFVTDFDGSGDMLDCISKRTGLPRLLLSLTVFLSAVVMIYICFSTIATAPEHRIPSQKLSIYGDMDHDGVLFEDWSLILNEKAQVHSQQQQQALQLPIKVKIETV